MKENLLYNDEELLQLSGIQHFVFCPREWALIYLEQAWSDNHLTAEGSLIHENVDNPSFRNTNGSPIITLRGIRLVSHILGFSGIADAVEIHPMNNAPTTKKDILKSKKYTLIPIEYKHGKRKISDCDRIQVATQAIILEEMLDIHITQGAIFYWTERHREYFEIDDNIRKKVWNASQQMHYLFSTKAIPKPTRQKGCRSCSLINLCMPDITNKNVSNYLKLNLNEEIT